MRDFLPCGKAAIMTTTNRTRVVLIQDCDSKKFLTADNNWSEQAERARDFETTLNAVAHTLAHRLRGAQAIVRFEGEAAPDVVVPLSCEQASSH